MTAPKRIQRKRTKGWRMPEGAVYVGRGSRWGNPFRVVKDGPWFVYNDQGRDVFGPEAYERVARQGAVDLFALHTGVLGLHEYDAETLAALRSVLAGRDLACWCPLDQPCHADVLLELANGGAPC